MLNYTIFQRLRHAVAGIPWAEKIYNIFRLLFTPSYCEDGLLTIHNCDFTRDPEFQNAYQHALGQQANTRIRWRAHVTQWAGFHARHLAGDFVECGVNRAFLSTSVMSYTDFYEMPDRRFYLFDTYDGLVEDLVSDADKAAYKNKYEDCYEFVRQSFKNRHNVIIVRGIVPDSLHTVEINKVAYLSIDMNCVQPEVKALEYFWPKLSSGAVVILDDYGFSGHEAQKEGADNFAVSAGVKVLTLPTGQGLIIKP